MHAAAAACSPRPCRRVHARPADPFDGTELPAEMFSKRQLAWMGVEDPGRYKHFLPRLSRKELGSFWDEYVEEEFDVEVRCGGFVLVLMLSHGRETAAAAWRE